MVRFNRGLSLVLSAFVLFCALFGVPVARASQSEATAVLHIRANVVQYYQVGERRSIVAPGISMMLAKSLWFERSETSDLTLSRWPPERRESESRVPRDQRPASILKTKTFIAR
jgi:hypothetical protein